MTKQLAPIDQLKVTINQMKPQFAMTLPKHINPDKFTRVLMTAVSTSPDLVNADRASLFAACMKSAQDGLLPDGREAVLLTFKTKNGIKAQYLPMIQGILKKIRNSGELATITAQVVFQNDTFNYWVDSDGEHLEHRPNMFGDRGDVIGVYGIAKTKDESIYIEVMTAKQVNAVRESSKSKDFGPWSGAFEEEMWKKTVIRRLSKKLPMSTDLEDFIKQDDDSYDLKTPQKTVAQIEVTQPEQPLIDNTKPSKLSQLISAPVETEQQPNGVNDEGTN